jgi:hypothetical protein
MISVGLREEFYKRTSSVLHAWKNYENNVNKNTELNEKLFMNSGIKNL